MPANSLQKQFPSLSNEKRIIVYDIGANNGDDTLYYLKKANLVVAVEANPDLCAAMSRRFENEIKEGKLAVVNCVVTASEVGDSVPFYLNDENHGLSSISPHFVSKGSRKLELPAMSAARLFSRFGHPHYVKIDIEGYDYQCLNSMFECGVFPEFVSAESHDIRVLAVLASRGGYRQFQLLEGWNIHESYFDHSITSLAGPERYSFPAYCSGPFGNDLKREEWVGSLDLLKQLVSVGLGWRDIHASKRRPSSVNRLWRLRFYSYIVGWKLLRIWKRIKGFSLRLQRIKN
jgi:FkbM family methyltransferase